MVYADNLCEWCGEGYGDKHQHHYPIPKALGGSNTITLCLECHRFAHSTNGDSPNHRIKKITAHIRGKIRQGAVLPPQPTSGEDTYDTTKAMVDIIEWKERRIAELEDELADLQTNECREDTETTALWASSDVLEDYDLALIGAVEYLRGKHPAHRCLYCGNNRIGYGQWLRSSPENMFCSDRCLELSIRTVRYLALKLMAKGSPGIAANPLTTAP